MFHPGTGIWAIPLLAPALPGWRLPLELYTPCPVRLPCASAEPAPRCQSPDAEKQKDVPRGGGALSGAGTCLRQLQVNSGGQRACAVGRHQHQAREPSRKPCTHIGNQKPSQAATTHSVRQRTKLTDAGQAGRAAQGHIPLLKQGPSPLVTRAHNCSSDARSSSSPEVRICHRQGLGLPWWL